MKTRLVVNLNSRSVADLDAQVQNEELNRTTIVNRAIQVYRLIMKSGGSMGLRNDDGTVDWVKIL